MPVMTRAMRQEASANAKTHKDMDVDDPVSDHGISKRVVLDEHKSQEISAKSRRRSPRKRKRSDAEADEQPKKRRRITRAKGKSKGKSRAKQSGKGEKTVFEPSKDDDSANEDAAEQRRIYGMQAMERRLYEKNGMNYVIGVDEAGRGPLAGPVVAAACYIPLDEPIAHIGDSKALTEERREQLFEILTNHDRIVYGVSIISHTEIDEINILESTLKAMRKSSVELNAKLGKKVEGAAVDYILVDGNRDPRFEESVDEGLSVGSEPIVKGDAKVYCIAAASIIAKVTRDRLMVEYDRQFPVYKFAQHKGYGTKLHRALIHEHGPCEIHRRCFQPVRGIVGWVKPKKKQADTRPKKPRGRKSKGKNRKSKSNVKSNSKSKETTPEAEEDNDQVNAN